MGGCFLRSNDPRVLRFQDEDVCGEEDLVGNKANISANGKRRLWWDSRRGTDEKNVRPVSK